MIITAISTSSATYTRSSATAEKKHVSCACLPRLANWSCNAQNTAESQWLYYFWHSNALIQEVLAENALCHEIAAQGHSRSFTLQSFASRQGVSYRHILLLAVSLKFSKMQGRRPYVFKVFTEYPLNLGSDCILMFSVNLTFGETLIMQFCYFFLQKLPLLGL